MNLHLLIFLLAIAAITATGCKTNITGPAPFNEATDAANDISVSFYTTDDQGDLVREEDSGSKRQLPPKSYGDTRITSQYVGLTAEAAHVLAQQQGYTFRVRNGITSAEFKSGRITAHTKDGIVQSIRVERKDF